MIKTCLTLPSEVKNIVFLKLNSASKQSQMVFNWTKLSNSDTASYRINCVSDVMWVLVWDCNSHSCIRRLRSTMNCLNNCYLWSSMTDIFYISLDLNNHEHKNYIFLEWLFMCFSNSSSSILVKITKSHRQWVQQLEALFKRYAPSMCLPKFIIHLCIP